MGTDPPMWSTWCGMGLAEGRRCTAMSAAAERDDTRETESGARRGAWPCDRVPYENRHMNIETGTGEEAPRPESASFSNHESNIYIGASRRTPSRLGPRDAKLRHSDRYSHTATWNDPPPTRPRATHMLMQSAIRVK